MWRLARHLCSTAKHSCRIHPGRKRLGIPRELVRRTAVPPARLYDAVRFSIFHYLKKETGRKALLIVALLDDQHSESTLEDARVALQQNDVIAYVVQVTDGPHDNCDAFTSSVKAS